MSFNQSNLDMHQSPNTCLCKTDLQQYEVYSMFHNNTINKIIHFVTIPIIIITTCHFIEKFHIVFDDEKLIQFRPKLNINYSVNLLTILQSMYCYYYFTWSWTIGFIMMFYFEGLIRLLHNLQYKLIQQYRSKFITDSIILTICISAWSLQFFGHHIEGNQPALMDSLSTAFITAPMFSLDFILKHL
jgi:uncharacterized membrane protein YGL010W